MKEKDRSMAVGVTSFLMALLGSLILSLKIKSSQKTFSAAIAIYKCQRNKKNQPSSCSHTCLQAVSSYSHKLSAKILIYRPHSSVHRGGHL